MLFREVKKVYFAGDSGYAHHFKHAGDTFEGFDLSLIPVGAYRPRWFMKQSHINPKEAVMAHKDLKSKMSLAIHFGTFQLTDEGIDDPINDLNLQLKEQSPKYPFVVRDNGGFIDLSSR